MLSHKLHSPAGELNPSVYPDNYIRRHELFPLLARLAKAPYVAIRIKRIDRLNHGSFSTVVRASGALIMIREVASGLAEVIPDLRYVQYFELNNEFENIKANSIYAVVDVKEPAQP